MLYTLNKNYWKNKKVFVTGHTGFKGSWLCIFLTYLGAEVTGYSLEPKTKPNLFHLANIKRIIKKSVISDIRNYNKLYKEIKKSNATILFHLAAQPLVRYSYTEPKETFDTNFSGSLNLLECIRKIKKVKTSIIITTDKVYDPSKNKIYKETDALGGLDPYSSSKVCVEFLFSSYVKSFFQKSKNQKLATVRAGNVIGGGDYSEDRLIPDIYRFSKKKLNIFLRNPLSIRPWQHVLEPLGGYLKLAEKLHDKNIKNLRPNWNFGPNISSCKPVKYVADYFAKSLNLKVTSQSLNKNNFTPETSILRLSNHKSKKYINWSPKWSLDTSLNKIVEWNKNVKNKNCLDICINQVKEYIAS